MGVQFVPGQWTVTSWNERAMSCLADERMVYRGPARDEALRIFERLSFWKTRALKGHRRGIVELISPNGWVSRVVRTGEPVTSYVTSYAHAYPYDGAFNSVVRLGQRAGRRPVA
jgi:hypothetical protein